MTPKVTVVGAGYVGLAMALLLEEKCDVTVVDIDAAKLTKLQSGISPLDDKEIIAGVTDAHERITWQTLQDGVYVGADFVVVCTPTDFDDYTGYFDTKHVESTVRQAVTENPSAYVIVKSTVPIGFTDGLRDSLRTENVCFSPEFLREGSALHDNYYPSRIIVGDGPRGPEFASILAACAKSPDVPVMTPSNMHAEAIKLFSNTYLALRVSYFNEMDTFAMENNLDMRTIAEGVGHDPRIGNQYNNPSFGYGGYCLPKDSKQLVANFGRLPQALMTAIVEANRLRKEHIARRVAVSGAETVGVYRLAMKADSDNFRSSSTTDVAKLISHQVDRVLIYEPLLPEGRYAGGDVVSDLEKFLDQSDLIIANRMHDDLNDHKAKVFTRDVYARD